MRKPFYSCAFVVHYVCVKWYSYSNSIYDIVNDSPVSGLKESLVVNKWSIEYYLAWSYISVDYICWFSFDALAVGNAYNPQRNRTIIVDQAGIDLTTFRLRQLPQIPVVQLVCFTPQKLCLKHSSNARPRRHWTALLKWTGVDFKTCVC